MYKNPYSKIDVIENLIAHIENLIDSKIEIARERSFHNRVDHLIPVYEQRKEKLKKELIDIFLDMGVDYSPE